MKLETVKMIKGDSFLICNLGQVSSFLDKGFKIVVEDDEIIEPVKDESEVTEDSEGRRRRTVADTPVADSISRQEVITKAVKAIFDRNNSDDFTGSGLPRIEVVAAESGIEDVTGQERSVAMENNSL